MTMDSNILLFCLNFPLLFFSMLKIFPNISLKKNPLLYIAPFSLCFILSFLLFHKDFGVTIIKLSTFGFDISFLKTAKNSLFAIVTSFLWAITNLYSTGYMKIEKKLIDFYSYLSLSMFCVLCIAFSNNMFFTFMMYEILSISTYKLVIYDKTDKALESGKFYLLTLLISSTTLFLPALILLQSSGCSLKMNQSCVLSLANYTNMHIAFGLIVYGTAKAALMPMHKWLPKAMIAQVPVSAFLHAVAVVKSGVFILLISTVNTFGLQNLHAMLKEGTYPNWLMYLSGISILLSSLIATKQKNIKKILAYSTISNLSYMIFCMSIFTVNSINASFLHLIAHSFAKITLFFFAGAIYKAYNITNTNQLAGIARKMPISSFCAVISILSIIGLPPTLGFWSKFYIFKSAIEQNNLFIISVLCISTILNIIYFSKIILKMFSSSHEENKTLQKTPAAMIIAKLITSLITFLLFFFPYKILNLMM